MAGDPIKYEGDSVIFNTTAMRPYIQYPFTFLGEEMLADVDAEGTLSVWHVISEQGSATRPPGAGGEGA